MNIQQIELAIILTKLRPNVQALVRQGVLRPSALTTIEEAIESLRSDGVYVASEEELAMK